MQKATAFPRYCVQCLHPHVCLSSSALKYFHTTTMMFMPKNLNPFVVVLLLQVLQFGSSLVHATASSSPSPDSMSTFSPGSQSESKQQKMDSRNKIIMALVISSSALGLIVLFLMCLWIYQNCCSKKSQKRNGETKDAEKGHVLAPMFGKLNSFERVSKKSSIAVFDYEALEKGTDNFRESNILGEGGYGRVYKAQLNGRLSVAVKKIRHGGPESEKEFQNEVVLLTKIQHPNVISLLGYCIHEETRLLVFELMHNGSLESQLHGPSHGSALSWQIRLKIALDIARGLDYLLEHCNPRVIHRDLKSSNILLDSSFNAKLSDFGLAVTNGSQDKNSAKLSGTLGYVAPEYLLDGKLTDKSDVYSFGVVLLELLLGRKPVEKLSPSQCQSIVTWAMPQLTDRSKLPTMVDPVIRGTMDLKHLYQVAAIAVLCVQPEPSYRPLITDVLHSLVPLVPVELGGTLRVAKFTKPEP